MKRQMLTLVVALAAMTSQAQPGAVVSGLQGMLDANNTNSLMNANEVVVTPLMKWDSESKEIGGGLKLDWWLSDQQGLSLEYDEFGDRSGYWQFGYQARTVFKGLEVAIGTGTRQAEGDAFGSVKLYLQPSLKWRMYTSDKMSASITFGADMIPGQRPNPFLGVGFTFWRF